MLTINFNKIKSKQVSIELAFQANYYDLDHEQVLDLMRQYRILSKRNDFLDVNIPSDRSKIADVFNKYYAEEEGLPEVQATYSNQYTLPDSMLSAYKNKYNRFITFTKVRPFYISLERYLKHYEKIKWFIQNDKIKITDVS